MYKSLDRFNAGTYTIISHEDGLEEYNSNVMGG